MTLVLEKRQERHTFFTNYVGFEERHVEKDADLVKAMWRLGNIDYNIGDVGIPAASNSSIIALDKTSNTTKKKYKKVVKSHGSYWNSLYNEFDSLLDLPESERIDRTYLKEARIIHETLSNSMKNILPKIDGKIVLDIVRDRAGLIQLGERELPLLFYNSLCNAARINAKSLYYGIEQDYDKFFESIIELNAFDLDSTEILVVKALQMVDATVDKMGDTHSSLTLYRGIAATIRLTWWRHRSTGLPDTVYGKLRERYQKNIILAFTERIKMKIQKNARRPFFTVKRINSIEEEFGIGHFSEKNYKCDYCGIGRNDVVLYECIGCTRAWYCSMKCHKREWSQHRLVCGKINNWRSKPHLIDSDLLHNWRECTEDTNSIQIILTALNGNLVMFCVDPVTDEVFDGFTDRPVRIKRGEEGNEADGNDRYLKRADL
jgi:hypothetical protein